MDRPALRRLLADIQAKRVDCVVVYKVDRLSRSIRDFAKIMEILEKHGATCVSVTQQFDTTTSLGRLTLNILLSFAQFRTGDHLRAHPRQTDPGAQAWQVDRRPCAAGVRPGGRLPGRQRGGGTGLE
jgi:predicted site-specific integrase-resolvase